MIYILAPYDAVSGGPELLQQLCHQIRTSGKQATMVYYHSWFQVEPSADVVTAYHSYGNPYTRKVEDKLGNVYVVPEIGSYRLQPIHHAKKVLWWLSIDNYHIAKSQLPYKINTLFGLYEKPVTMPDILHLYQSFYAKQYLMGIGVSENQLMELSDYLSNEFIEHAKSEQSIQKQDKILYNPKKGLAFTQQLMAQMPDAEFCKLEGLTKEEMRLLMQSSKLYIDFGNHPGKDRIPREAAVSGCCVVTGRRGAAGNEVDVDLPPRYKVDEQTTPLPQVAALLREIMIDYDACRTDFDAYRKEVLGEKAKFESAVQKFLVKVDV